MNAEIIVIGRVGTKLYLGNYSERIISEIDIDSKLEDVLKHLVVMHTIPEFNSFSELEDSFYGLTH